MLPPIVVNPPKVVLPTWSVVILSTAATASPPVIPKIFASICGAALEKFTGGLVTVHAEPLFVDSGSQFNLKFWL